MDRNPFVESGKIFSAGVRAETEEFEIINRAQTIKVKERKRLVLIGISVENTEILLKFNKVSDLI
jgi:hypothetical protein